MRFLSNKEKKELKENLPKGFDFNKKDDITIKENVVFKNKIPFLIEFENKFLPHLKSILESDYKSVFVDMGAIRFILKGADVMRAGITNIDFGIEKDQIVLVKDQNYQKNLAIGFALFSKDEMEKQKSGKSIRVYHFLNDKFYI